MIVYTDNTALDFWAWHAATGSNLERPKRIRRLDLTRRPSPPSNIRSACEHFRTEGAPISVLVGSDKNHRNEEDIIYRRCPEVFSSGSFYKLSESIYVISPELAFVRLANYLDKIDLIKLGCDLTAKFVLGNNYEHQLIASEPLCTTSSLQRYIERSEGFHGIKKARRALKYVIPNSASPLETELALALALPKQLGGYALPKPMLNYSLSIEDGLSEQLGRRSIVVDMFWPKAKLAIEYDSNEWHSGEKKFVFDSKRRNDIRHLGYDVTTITYDEFSRISSMDKIAENLRHRLGKRDIPPTSGYGIRQITLRTKLKDIRNSVFCSFSSISGDN